MQVTDLGRMPYAQALQVQRATHAQVSAGTAPATLLLVEHDPVITVGRRAALRGQVARDLRVDRARLAQLGIDLQTTDRGGEATYHGPGQVVVYPIVRLDELRLAPGGYVHRLELAVIDALGRFGVRGRREPGIIGVWVDLPVAGATHPLAKICALGVRVKRNTTLHGLALNVTTDLDHFETIVPCGLAQREVTSLRQVLGDAVPSMDQVKAALVEALRSRLTCSAADANAHGTTAERHRGQ